MDPFTAISLASSIVQFVDYSTKLINGAREMYDSASGMTEENRSLESIVSKMKELSSKLLPSTGPPRSEDEKALCRLAAECNILSDQILELLGKIKPKAPKSKRQSTLAALRNKIHEKEKLELQKRLESCRSQLELQLNFLTGSETKARLQNLVNSAEGDTLKLEQLQSQMDQLRRGVTISSISPDAQTQLQQLFNLSDDACQIITQQRILKSLAFHDMHGRFDAVDNAHYKTFKWIFRDSQQAEADGESSDDDAGYPTTEDEEGEDDGDDPTTDDEGSSRENDEDQRAFENGEAAGDENTNSARLEERTSVEPKDKRHGHFAAESFIHWLASGTGIFHVSGKLGSGKSTLMKYLCEHKRTRKELEVWAGDRMLVFANFFFWKPGTTLQRSLNGLFRSLLYDTLKACPDLIPMIFPDHWNQMQLMPWQAQADLDFGNREIRAAFSQLIANRNFYHEHCFCFFIDGLDEYKETRQDDYKTLVELLCSWTASAPEDVKLCVSSREYNVFLNAFPIEKRLCLQDLTRGDMERYIRDKLRATPNKDLEDFVEMITSKGNGIFLWVALVVKILRERLEDGHNLSDLEEELDSLPNELEDLFEYLLKSVGKPARRKAYEIFAMLRELKPYKRQLSLLSYSFLEDYRHDPDFAMRTTFPYSSMSDDVRNSRVKAAFKKANGYCRGLIEDDKNYTFNFTHRSIPEFLEKPDIQSEMNFYLKDFNAADALCQLLLSEIRTTALKSIEREHMSLTVYAMCDIQYRYKLDHAPYPFRECLQSSILQHAVEEPLETIDTAEKLLVSRYDPFQISAFLGDHEYVAWKVIQDPRTMDSAVKCSSLLRWILVGVFCKAKSVNFTLIEFVLRQGLSPQMVMISPDSKFDQVAQMEPEMTLWQYFLVYSIVTVEVLHRTCAFRKEFGETIETFFRYGADPHLHFSILKESHLLLNESLDWQHYSNLPAIEVTFGKDERKIVCRRAGYAKSILETGEEVSLRDLIKLWALENEGNILRLLDRRVQELEQAGDTQDQHQRFGEESTIQELRASDLEPTSQLQSESTLDQAEDPKEVVEAEDLVPALSQDIRKFGSWWEFVEWKSIITFLIGICLAVVVLRFM